MKKVKDSVSIVLCGEAGQGIETIEIMLGRLFKQSGYHISATKEYMSRVRGGSNSIQIRVSSNPVRAYSSNTDIAVMLDKKAVEHLKGRINKDTVVLADSSVKEDGIINIPFLTIAEELGNKIYFNSVAAGVICGLFGIKQEIINALVKEKFSKKGEDIINKNIQAFSKGKDEADKLKDVISIQIKPDENQKDKKVFNGAKAVALGALCGGCNFVSSYPMSPSTGVLVNMAAFSKDFPVIVEQAEDEISAVNMAIGAWYAGARALVTTSGGGFALMGEGISLSGMIETPVVIHLAQRPGPATGLPTRTEQGDLELALYNAHGEFPKIIYAPGTLRQAFCLSAKAFNAADKFQSPAVILTDQYLMDSYYDEDELPFDEIKIENYASPSSDENYKRYKLTENGISPRALPGGKGLVCADSDEHTEEGHITEDLELRVKMQDKRLSKYKEIEKDFVMPEIINPERETAVICWGSTYNIVLEAYEKLNSDKLSFIHFSQVYPLPEKLKEVLKNYKKIIVIENNSTGQFSKLLQLHLEIKTDEKILKYSGLPFSFEEVYEALKNKL